MKQITIFSQRKFNNFTKVVTSAVLASSLLLTSGCSLFSVYKIDIPQGTQISQQQAMQVQVGMTSAQVLNLLGSPAITDTMNGNRWDYIYTFKAGTFAKREKKADVVGNQQLLSIYFSQNRVIEIQGLENLPPL